MQPIKTLLISSSFQDGGRTRRKPTTACCFCFFSNHVVFNTPLLDEGNYLDISLYNFDGL